VLATVGESLKGTALVISKLKQKPLEAESRSADEEVMTQRLLSHSALSTKGWLPFLWKTKRQISILHGL
jgi:hypothetical protein